MKRELEHFYIGASYGGNQDWFPTFMMRIGGCGAETACDSSIYFAMHRGIDGIAPEVLINGYDDRTDLNHGAGSDTSGEFLVKAVTYSSYEWLDLKGLWNTGCIRRGGLVLYSDVQRQTIE